MKIMTAALIMVFATSCTKTNDTGITLSIKGITTPSAIKKSANVEGFIFSEAILGIKEIEIKKEDESLDDSDMKFDFDGSYVVDLLGGTSTPALGFMEFLPGTYNKFESKTAPVLEGGKSLSIKGSFTDNGGKVYNFEFTTNAEIEFEFESDSGFVLTEGKVLELLVSVNLPLLFEGVDFSKATTNLSGIIVINESSNASLAVAIKNNIDNAAEMENENENEHESEND